MRSQIVRASIVIVGLFVVAAPTTVLAEDPAPETTVSAPETSEAPAEPSTTTPTTTTVAGSESDPVTTTEPATSEPASTETTVAASTEGEALVESVAESTTTLAAPADSTPEPAALTAEELTEQQVTITITSPIDGSTVPVGEPVEVTGVVTIGVLGTGVSVVYVVDTSGSTDNDGGDCNGDGIEDAGDDFNGDGSPGEIIDCEIAGVQELEQQLDAINANIETGLVSFAAVPRPRPDSELPAGPNSTTSSPPSTRAVEPVSTAAWRQ